MNIRQGPRTPNLRGPIEFLVASCRLGGGSRGLQRILWLQENGGSIEVLSVFPLAGKFHAGASKAGAGRVSPRTFGLDVPPPSCVQSL